MLYDEQIKKIYKTSSGSFSLYIPKRYVQRMDLNGEKEIKLIFIDDNGKRRIEVRKKND